MNRQLQIRNGQAETEWSGANGFPIPPSDEWIFVDVTDRPDATVGMRYDAATDTFSPAPVVPRTIVSKAQVVGVLTAQEWSEMNKYHPTADAPYNDAEVFWAITQFNLADRINLADPRITQIFTMLVGKNLLSEARAAEITAALLALA